MLISVDIIIKWGSLGHFAQRDYQFPIHLKITISIYDDDVVDGDGDGDVVDDDGDDDDGDKCYR